MFYYACKTPKMVPVFMSDIAGAVFLEKFKKNKISEAVVKTYSYKTGRRVFAQMI